MPTMPKVKLLANGPYTLAPLFLSILAFILSMASLGMCNFIAYKVSGETIMYSGLFCYEVDGEKEKWDDEEEDYLDATMTARKMGIVSFFFGFVVVVIYSVAVCISFHPAIFMATGLLCLLVTIFEGFKLWLFREEDCDYEEEYYGDVYKSECVLDAGGKACITAVIFWFLAALLISGHGMERMVAQKISGEHKAAPSPQGQIVEPVVNKPELNVEEGKN